MNVSAAALAAFSVIGFGASIEDIVRSRVTNRWIVAGLAAALLCYAALGFKTLLGLGCYFLPVFYRDALLHAVLSAAAALALWHWRLWPAGDAKLYFILSLLLVLIDSRLWGFPRFLFLTTLVNIFVSAALFVLAVMCAEWAAIVVSSLKRFQAHEIRAFFDRLAKRLSDEWGKRRNYAVIAWNTFAVFFLVRALPGMLPWQMRIGGGVSGSLALYAAMYLFWGRLGPILIRKESVKFSFFFFTLAVFSTFFLFHQWPTQTAAEALKRASGFGLFLPLMRKSIDYYLIETRKIPVGASALKEGMILSDESWEKVVSRLPAQEGLVRYADGLSEEDIEMIRSRRAGAEDVSLTACRYRPFACWIVLGCLWSLYSRQNLALWMVSKLRLL